MDEPSKDNTSQSDNTATLLHLFTRQLGYVKWINFYLHTFHYIYYIIFFYFSHIGLHRFIHNKIQSNVIFFTLSMWQNWCAQMCCCSESMRSIALSSLGLELQKLSNLITFKMHSFVSLFCCCFLNVIKQMHAYGFWLFRTTTLLTESRLVVLDSRLTKNSFTSLLFKDAILKEFVDYCQL